MRRILSSLILFLLFFYSCGQAWGWQSAVTGSIAWQGFRLPPVQTDAAGAEQEASSERPLLLSFTFVPPADVYYYGTKSTEGLPTSIILRHAPVSPFAAKPARGGKDFASLLHENGQLLPLHMPEARPKKETAFASYSLTGGGNSDTPIFAGPVTFWAQIPSIAPFYSAAAVEVSISGLFCSSGSCTPFDSKAELVIDLAEADAFPMATEQPWWADWQNGIAVQLAPDEAGQSVLEEAPVRPDEAGTPDFTRAFGAGTRSFGGQTTDGAQGNGAVFGAQTSLEAYSAFFATIEPRYSNPSLEVQDLGGAIFFGILAGFILNLMPCVLPVVSLKFTALMAASAMESKKARARAFREHCLIFAAGILAWFVVLAFLLGTAGWAWGELFQSPQVVVILALIMFLLALSLFGVYTLPILDLRVGSETYPRLQSFGSGLLATLLATPCSGPLLGGVLGWALRQPLPVLMLAVGSVGVGMALPYFVLALSPNMVHLLPRPGNWTLRLEQLLGFFLMGSVVYMITLLPDTWVSAFLFNLLCVAIAAWLWGQIGHLAASRTRRFISRSLAILLVVCSATWGSLSIQREFHWEAFDPEIFMRDLGTEPMLLEFTADWCPSCKAMEHTTLSQSRMMRLREQYKMRTIQVDLTRNDPVAKELLLALGSGSIPVIALFPKGDEAGQPLILRDIVTPSQLEEALSRMF